MKRAVLLVTATAAIACIVEPPAPVQADEDLCEREAANRGAECAVVYAFAMGSSNPLGSVEKCSPERFRDLAETMHGPSWPSDSERFEQYTLGLVDPPCFWVCPPAVGCNAYDSCFCAGVP